MRGITARSLFQAIRHRGLLSTLFLVASMSPTYAQQHDISPAERETVLQVARSTAEQDIGKPLQLQAQSVNVVDGWAFVYARMLDDKGHPIDYAGTQYAEAAREGGKSDVFVALLRKQDGHWRMREHATGPTDAAWLGWTTQDAPQQVYQVPED